MPKRLSAKSAAKTKAKKTVRHPAAPKTDRSKTTKEPEKLYTLTVYIIGGPLSEEYEGKETSRTIQIKGSQTLEDLHEVIFAAFDRWENHFYEFNLGTGPYDRSKIYSLRIASIGYDDSEKPIGEIETTTIDDLGLKVGRAFGYTFDFGDDWQHQINVEAIEPAPTRGKFPRIIKRVGKSPPQYPDVDEDDDEYDDDED
ncbi:MAG: plasmid pRiA4b ORF-3 family protein [candidate division KSB1 bacterium]|nr:plasmid pRiA4b ORF-3 family protein [candidate division KSB1 bacterium]MDZ7304946.1 plasmid pRiA4b ORF-3 family protein [candidate division KSB1 bacterium]MDZ7311663.1 plasmid pRiA4b ORF-3 family protein [candidate division KSB1 bacterium]